MRILIIEDKEKHISSAKKFAQECGHDVVIATTYDQAEMQLCYGDHFGREKPVKNFDVVLTDLFLPASSEGLGTSNFEGTSQPYGLSLALLAMRLGTKAIGIFTDGNHHDNPMTWALDTLRATDGKTFEFGDITMLCCSNGPMFSSWMGEGSVGYVPKDDPLHGAKDWMEFFLKLMNGRPPTLAL